MKSIMSDSGRSLVVCTDEMCEDVKDMYGIDLGKVVAVMLDKNEQVGTFGMQSVSMRFSGPDRFEIRLWPSKRRLVPAR